jgi:hypothetical protein
MTRYKTVAPKPAPAKAKRVKKAKAELRSLEHKFFGVGLVIGVFTTDSGGLVADVQFGANIKTLSMDQQYWLGSVADLLAAMPPQSRKQETKPVRKPEPADDEEADGERELELNAAGHFSEGEDAGDAETEDGAHEHDAAEVESETESEELVGADA